MSKEVPFPDFDRLDKLLRLVRVSFESETKKACEDRNRKPIGWTAHQALILIAASQDAHEHCTRASLAVELGLKPATTSGLVTGLVRKGFVSEAKNAKFVDGRRKQLRLTPKGQAAYHGALAQRDVTVGAVLRPMSEPQRKAFFRHLGAMCAVAEALHAEED